MKEENWIQDRHDWRSMLLRETQGEDGILQAKEKGLEHVLPTETSGETNLVNKLAKLQPPE